MAKTTGQKIASAKSAASKWPVEKIVVTNSRGSKAIDTAIKSGIAKTDKTYKAPKEGALKDSQRATATKSGWAGAKVASKTGENAKVVAARIQSDRSKTAGRAKNVAAKINPTPIINTYSTNTFFILNFCSEPLTVFVNWACSCFFSRSCFFNCFFHFYLLFN